MSRKRTMLAWAVSFTVALFALSFVIQLVDEVGPPILLDPNHKLEIPPPPESLYQMSKESQRQPSSHDSANGKKPNETPASSDLRSLTESLAEEKSTARALQAMIPSKKNDDSPMTPRDLYYAFSVDLGSTDPTPRLGLRYSVLRQQPGGTPTEADPDTHFLKDETLMLTVEVNQASYLYVATPHFSKTWRILWPVHHKEGSPIAVKTRTRYTLPLPDWEKSADGTRYLRIAFLIAREPDVSLTTITPASVFPSGLTEKTTPRQPGELSSTFYSIHSPHLLIQKVRPIDSSHSTEHAVYIVEDLAQHSRPLVATLILSAD